MKLVSWNVNGVRSAHSKTLPQFLTEQQPDVLCLQETKIHCDSLLPNDAPYSSYGTCCSHAETRKGYSGVATFTSQSIGDMRPKTSIGFGIADFDREGRTVITDYGPFALYNMYFPSGTTGDVRQDFKYQFLRAFTKHLQSLPQKLRSKLVICGDFNICHRPIDIHHPKEAEQRQLSGFLPDERKWMDEFVALGFVDTFRSVHGDKAASYTWWSFRANSRAKNLGWRIDYFFVSKDLEKKISDAQIYPDITGSDHCPISLTLDV